jgi:hypothetical protein
VAEGARLESVFRFIPNESSNLSLTAIYRKARYRKITGFLLRDFYLTVYPVLLAAVLFLA